MRNIKGYSFGERWNPYWAIRCPNETHPSIIFGLFVYSGAENIQGCKYAQREQDVSVNQTLTGQLQTWKRLKISPFDEKSPGPEAMLWCSDLWRLHRAGWSYTVRGGATWYWIYREPKERSATVPNSTSIRTKSQLKCHEHVMWLTGSGSVLCRSYGILHRAPHHVGHHNVHRKTLLCLLGNKSVSSSWLNYPEFK